MISITLKFERNTKNHAVYKEIGGINKLYLPKGYPNEITIISLPSNKTVQDALYDMYPAPTPPRGDME